MPYILDKLSLHPYPMDLWIVVSDNPAKDVAQVNLAHKGLEIPWPSDAAAWTQDVLYHGHIITVVFDAESFDANTAAHESIHVLNHIIKQTGIKYDIDNDEAICYLVGWIVECFHNSFESFKRKYPKKFKK